MLKDRKKLFFDYPFDLDARRDLIQVVNDRQGMDYIAL
jgi:hypothetical protein